MSKQLKILIIEDEQIWIGRIQEILNGLGIEGIFLKQTESGEVGNTITRVTWGDTQYTDAQIVGLIKEFGIKLVLADGTLQTQEDDDSLRERHYYQGRDYVKKISNLGVDIWSISSDSNTEQVFGKELKSIVKGDSDSFKQSLARELISWKRENTEPDESEGAKNEASGEFRPF